jgi:hypothetical protein
VVTPQTRLSPSSRQASLTFPAAANRIRNASWRGLRLLWHYAFGKPKEVVDLTTTGVSIVFESTLNPDALRGPA